MPPATVGGVLAKGPDCICRAPFEKWFLGASVLIPSRNNPSPPGSKYHSFYRSRLTGLIHAFAFLFFVLRILFWGLVCKNTKFTSVPDELRCLYCLKLSNASQRDFFFFGELFTYSNIDKAIIGWRLRHCIWTLYHAHWYYIWSMFILCKFGSL